MTQADRIANIPYELKQATQWINWKYEIVDGKETKVPLSPYHGGKCDATDPKSWASFETVLSNAANHSVGIGFALTQNDPYVVVDIDDPSKKFTSDQCERIYKIGIDLVHDFNSYVEYSPSGKGLHIWAKADIPPEGVRSSADCIELYSSARFMTVTGMKFNGSPTTVERADEIANVLHSALSRRNKPIDVVEQQRKETPDQLIERIRSWSNGARFFELANMPFGVGDDSAIDQGVMNFIVQACRNVELSREAFELTPRAKRSKWQRTDYQDRTISKAFDKLEGGVQLDFTGLIQTIKSELERGREAIQIANVSLAENGTPSPAKEPPPKPTDGYTHGKGVYTNPGGLLGDIMEYVTRSAYSPLPEASLGAAIGLMSGICGRAYSIEGLGLNTYTVIVASSGSGKNAAIVAPQQLFNHAVGLSADTFKFIGNKSASAQALYKSFNDTPSYVSFIDEFGEVFRQMLDPRESGNAANLVGPFMDLYSRSGPGSVLAATMHSDREKNSKRVISPAFSLVGLTVPKTFYAAITPESITKGLIPRISIIDIDYENDFERLNINNRLTKPEQWLSDKLHSLCQSSHNINAGIAMGNMPVIVGMTEEARAVYTQFVAYAMRKKNAADRATEDHIKSIWSRAHEKALKLAALVAVGHNMYAPQIQPDQMEWALRFAEHDVTHILGKVARGETGTPDDESVRFELVRSVFKRFLAGDLKPRNDHEAMHRTKACIPWAVIQRTLGRRKEFVNMKAGKGSNDGLLSTVKAMVSLELLQQMSATEGVKNGSIYAILNTDWFAE